MIKFDTRSTEGRMHCKAKVLFRKSGALIGMLVFPQHRSICTCPSWKPIKINALLDLYILKTNTPLLFGCRDGHTMSKKTKTSCEF